jgi:hypothetical protein
MIQIDLVAINRLIKTNAKDQSFLLRYFSKLPLEYRVEIANRHRKILHSLRANNSEIVVEIISYCSMILAIKTLYTEEQKLSQKLFTDMSMEEIAELSLISIKRFDNKQASSTPKRDKLIGYWAEVTQLKKAGKGSRYISKYLLSKHRFKIGHTLIQTTWNDLETTKL